MHKFKIEIKLENKDYCNGCPCLKHSADFDSWVMCGIFKKEITHNVQTFPEIKHTGYFNRLDICKEQNKEVHNG